MLRNVTGRVYNLLNSSKYITCTLVKMSSTSSHEDEVLCEKVYSPGGCGSYQLLTLNKPKTLNALSMNMIDLLTTHIKAAVKDDSVKLIVVRGGERAFCAGGDIRSITEGGTSNPLSRDFFRREYQLNYMTGTLPVPYVAIINGITMGGGVGISVHSPYRVATETTTFAMPETAIGLFPDVGGGYFLPRLQGHLGMFLSLTGHRLKGRDVVYGGIATHLVTKDKIPLLMNELSKSCDGMRDNSYSVVSGVLDTFHSQCIETDDKEFSLNPYMDIINSCFCHDSVEGIIDALKCEGSDWSLKQLQLLNKMSPTSLKVTHRQVMEGRDKSLADCLVMEYRLSQRCMEGKDFYEGVRAVLVEKDNSPQWDPPTLEGVTQEVLDKYFAPLVGQEELSVQPLSKL